MAGGKETPRQKMINLMYLVFIAMLAMQMDRKVLSSFGHMKDKLEVANSFASKNTKTILEGLSIKAKEQPDKYKEKDKQAKQIHELSTELYEYLATIKSKLYEGESEKFKKDFESQKNSDKLDELFFKGDKYTEEGQKFVNAIKNYREKIIKILGNSVPEEVIDNIKIRFNTDDDKSDEGIKIDWFRSRYEGMPLITSVSNMSQIQSDIKTTELEVYNALVGGQLESDVSMSNYTGVVTLDKTAFYPGEKVTGSVMLGRYDETLKPTRIEYNGNKNYKKFKDGRVLIDEVASSVGDKPIEGIIYFTEKGEEVPVAFKSTYSVIPKPNDAVISADKMNVVYKGLANPLTISIPGVPSNKISASAPGLRHKGGDRYEMTPRGNGFVTINVSGILPSGDKITSHKKFRIKDIPSAATMVRNQYEKVSMPKSSIGNITVEAGLPDFLFDLKLNVLSFKIKVPGQPAIVVQGTQMNARARGAINQARRGDMITIFDVKASVVGGGGYQVKKVFPIVINVSN